MVTPVRSVRLDDDLWGRLVMLSEVHDVPVSDFVRDALNKYFERIEN